MNANFFHIYDPHSNEYLGIFSGSKTRNTDGIALTPVAFGNFNAGAFFTVHNDGNVAAFSWQDIACQLQLSGLCGKVLAADMQYAATADTTLINKGCQ